MPASALTHGEPELWIALKPFARLNRSTRARWSERHADSCRSCACVACRCWRRGGVSRRRQHERQASAHAPDVRLNSPSRASKLYSAQREPANSCAQALSNFSWPDVCELPERFKFLRHTISRWSRATQAQQRTNYRTRKSLKRERTKGLTKTEKQIGERLGNERWISNGDKLNWAANKVKITESKIVCLLLVLGVLTAHAITGISYQMQLGNPSNATADTNNHSHFLIQRSVLAEDYNDTLRQPNWVSWDLTTTDVGSSGRSSIFYQDTNLPTGFYQVKPTDYSGSGYDRGHMCPSADRTDTVANNDAVFFMSNIIPQTPDNNQGWWANLENDCRTIAAAGNELLITCGPSGFGTNRTDSAGLVYIASNVWKIIVVVPNGSGSAFSRITAATRVIAVNTPNTAGVRSTPWTNFLTSVNQIQTNTGYNFFTTLPPYTASVLRAKIDGQPTPVLPPPLTSSITNGHNLALSWPADAAGFTLQQNPNVATTNWTTYSGTLTTNGNTVTAVLPTTALNNFYRLKHP